MTSTAEETEILEGLDFAPPCSVKRRHPGGSPPSVVAIFAKPLLPCGCEPQYPMHFLCDPCWTHFTTRLLHCGICKGTYRLFESLARVVWL